jgi:hypothetical protein
MTSRASLSAILIPLLALTVWCGVAVHRFTVARASIKYDSSVVNSIKYGLLSVDIWRDRSQEIVSGSIGAFALSRGQENDLKKIISNVLQTLITEADAVLQKRRKTLSEKIRKFVVSTFFDVSDLRKRVPALTQTIIDEIKKPTNTSKLKHLAQVQFDAYSSQSYDNERDPSPLNSTLAQYQSTSPAEFNQKTQGIINDLEHRPTVYSRIMLGCLFVFLCVWWGARRNPEVQKLLFTFGVGFAFAFVVTALTTPMMEIDARIDKVDIILVGKHLTFQDQVLFYRSKSILQVVKTMLDTGDAGSVVVGALLLAFSILFPISKLISVEWYLLGGRAIRANKWIQFFAFKSGKWSMADVMVISIFMAYIGFNGILKSQLESLNIKTETLECISTSGTSLQPGCMLFAAFVLLGLFLSFMLERIVPRNADEALSHE